MLASVGVLGAFSGATMADERDLDLPPARRRRLIAWAVQRSLLSATVLVALYYLLPLDRPWDSDTAIRLLLGLAIITGFMAWQVRIIAADRYPGPRAAEALALILPLYLLTFASTYFLMERASAASFTESLTRTDALYFTVTTFSAVGFGDIAAKSTPAHVVVIVQIFADLVVLGVGVRVLLGAVRQGRQHRPGRGDDPGPAAT
jgi:voltage-gated potassium channel